VLWIGIILMLIRTRISIYFDVDPDPDSNTKYYHTFKYLRQHNKILFKIGIDTDPDRHTLDGDPDPAK